MSILLYVCVLAITDSLSSMASWIQLSVGICFGISVYVIVSFLFKVESFLYIKNMIFNSKQRL